MATTLSPHDRRRSHAVDRLLAAHAQVCAAQAEYVRALAAVGECAGSDRSLNCEVALVLRIDKDRAATELAYTDALVHRLPRTLAALNEGTVDLYKAFSVAELTAPLSDEQAVRADEILADRLEKTPGNLRRAIRTVVEQIDPEGVEERRQDCEADRKVTLCHRDYGWSQLCGDLPAHVASAIYQSLTDGAKALRKIDPTRTMDQLRADIFADRLLAAANGDASVKAQVYVYVDLFTLWSLNNNPGELPGYGFIPAEMARQIAADPSSTWSRILTDPDNGQLLSVGRTKYRPPADLADYVRVRARTCQHPGCNQPAQFADLDHTEDWAQGGETTADELRGYCRYHHLLKNEPGWAYEAGPDGATTITTPAGRTYTSSPEPFHEPRYQEPPPF
jgi:hypothetical protein